MTEVFVALITGGFALIGAGAGALLTRHLTREAQTDQHKHELELQQRALAAEARASEVEERRRIKRAELAPLFAALDEAERYIANRAVVATFGNAKQEQVPSTASLSPEQWLEVKRRAREKALKGLELGEAVSSLSLRLTVAAMRVSDPVLMNDVIVFATELEGGQPDQPQTFR